MERLESERTCEGDKCGRGRGTRPLSRKLVHIWCLGFLSAVFGIVDMGRLVQVRLLPPVQWSSPPLAVPVLFWPSIQLGQGRLGKASPPRPRPELGRHCPHSKNVDVAWRAFQLRKALKRIEGFEGSETNRREPADAGGNEYGRPTAEPTRFWLGIARR